jgi:hypothetical protein
MRRLRSISEDAINPDEEVRWYGNVFLDEEKLEDLRLLTSRNIDMKEELSQAHPNHALDSDWYTRRVRKMMISLYLKPSFLLPARKKSSTDSSPTFEKPTGVTSHRFLKEVKSFSPPPRLIGAMNKTPDLCESFFNYLLRWSRSNFYYIIHEIARLKARKSLNAVDVTRNQSSLFVI